MPFIDKLPHQIPLSYWNLSDTDRVKVKNMLLNGTREIDLVKDFNLKVKELKTLKNYFKKNEYREILETIKNQPKARRFSIKKGCFI